MLYSLLPLLLTSLTLTSALPAITNRAVTELNQGATAEAHPRDNTATRAFSNTEIKVFPPAAPLPSPAP
jgi:hypothetical protein